jgi:hypothetical protein
VRLKKQFEMGVVSGSIVHTPPIIKTKLAGVFPYEQTPNLLPGFRAEMLLVYSCSLIKKAKLYVRVLILSPPSRLD